ncbi:MAG: F0F1 ATP synthase subunit B [Bacteroidaceae bacterium]|nr:F0F1 ATP synthase subunit B [Bacteroidaceae bacterium]
MSFLLPDAGLLFWMLVVFGIVFFILSRYGFPAIIDMVNERKKFIDESVQSAKEANEKLAAINAESQAILKSAHDEQARLLREAATMRDELIKEARERAEKEGEKMLAETRRVIEMEKEDAVRDIRRQVAILSVEIAQKILRRELSDDVKQESVIEQLINETISQE